MAYFYATTLCVLILSLLLGNVQAASVAKQPYRTGFHFQPRQNFMNDPNGPMLYRGIYHLFYQYNPIGHGSTNGPRIWGHSTSTDLINWTIQPVTLKPQTSSNNQSSWSGSTTILPGNKLVILFTGVLNSQNEEVQNIAIPANLSDLYLKHWILSPKNPIITPTLDNKIDPQKFRDPTTAWRTPDGHWRVAVGGIQGNRGMALLYKSKDFINWVQAKHPLYSEKNGGMWECPDFYPIYTDNNRNIGAETSTIGRNVKHVLKVSLMRTQNDVYAIGTYDVKKDLYYPSSGFLNDSSLRYDYGNYYASKTFYDGFKKRRILFGWVKESIPDSVSAKIGWAGIQAIPRNIWVDNSSKQLMQWPVRELESLRRKQVTLSNKVLEESSLTKITGISAAQADVEVSFKLRNLKSAENFESKWSNDPQSLCNKNGVSEKGVFGPFGLLTLSSNDLEENTGVFFRIFNANNKPKVLMCSDQRRSSMNQESKKITYGTFVDVDPIKEGLLLRVLIDHSVVESYAGEGKNVITARVYPTLAIADNAKLYMFNNGTASVELVTLHAWSMKAARIV